MRVRIRARNKDLVPTSHQLEPRMSSPARSFPLYQRSRQTSYNRNRNRPITLPRYWLLPLPKPKPSSRSYDTLWRGELGRGDEAESESTIVRLSIPAPTASRFLPRVLALLATNTSKELYSMRMLCPPARRFWSTRR